MSVRKRKWSSSREIKLAKAEGREPIKDLEAWICDYVDAKGVRRQKTFAKKKEADAFASKADVEVREGTHVADRDTVTVEKAGALWIASGESAGLERSTITQRKNHLENHIKPLIGSTLLSKLTLPAVRDFEDRLRKEDRSPAMTKKILTSLGSILADANERGLATRNPVRDIRGGRKGRERRQEKRQKGRLEIGVDIPSRDEIKALIGTLDAHWRPLLLTAIFTGMRSSEIRGLRWQDVDFKRGEINVRQRVDQFREVGPPKSEAGARTIPVPPLVINALKELKLKAGNKPFVFANPDGESRSHSNVVTKGLQPAMIRAGVTIDTGEVDKKGKPILKAKYSGLHALRHFYASWLINRKEDGGLGLPAKVVQERLGHSSIVMTMDVYGHLFPRGDDGKEMADAASALLT
ncbi:site-specific integrase [Ensifer sp. MPMI2T]|nr:site-specific integrase [Ensifer sp. MPMI2T]